MLDIELLGCFASHFHILYFHKRILVLSTFVLNSSLNSFVNIFNSIIYIYLSLIILYHCRYIKLPALRSSLQCPLVTFPKAFALAWSITHTCNYCEMLMQRETLHKSSKYKKFKHLLKIAQWANHRRRLSKITIFRFRGKR